MKAIAYPLILAAVISHAASAPVEVWLTPQHKAQLSAITSRPYMVQRVSLGKGLEVVTWRNGAREWATTQTVARVQGSKSSNGWQSKVDAVESDKKALLDDLRAIQQKPSKLAIEKIIEKHERVSDSSATTR